MVVAGKYARIILNPNLVTYSCIGILYRGLDEWPINTEIPGMTLLFVE
jgi:hypothetical protein